MADSVVSVGPSAATWSPIKPVTPLAACFCLGIAVAGPTPPAFGLSVPIGVAVAVVAVVVAAGLEARVAGPARRRVAFGCLGLAVAALGWTWMTLTDTHATPGDLGPRLGEESTPAFVRGVALTAPVRRPRSGGVFTRFDYRPTPTTFTVRVESLVARGGRTLPIDARVLVRVRETIAPFRPGARVQIRGRLRRPAGPRNPGERDAASALRRRGLAGVIDVSGRELIATTPSPPNTLAAIAGWRDTMRRRVEAWLLTGLPPPSGDVAARRRVALLAAILLGRRDGHLVDAEGESASVAESFRHAGLAHVLAVSGLHLAVVVGLVCVLARTFGGRGSGLGHGALLIAVVLLYLLVVEVRLPVLRAGVMVIAAGLGLSGGRRWSLGSLVALTAVGLLVWRPDQLFHPGFQLSFGVVLALVHLAPRVRRRWFGPRDRRAGSSVAMLGQWAADAVAVSVVAWAVSAPLAMCHFGLLSLWTAPLSVVAVPAVATLLTLGYAKVALAMVLPSAGLLVGLLLTQVTDVVLAGVDLAATLPGAALRVPPPSTTWTLVTLAWVTAWGVGVAARRPRTWLLAGVAIVAWQAWPRPLLDQGVRFRVDMLAVGDGSCYVLRGGGETIVFDAGSSSDAHAGTRTIVPALHTLGVRHVDRLLISHANLDHFSAAIDVVDAFGVERVAITPQFARRAAMHPDEPAATLLAALRRRQVAITRRGVGDVMTLDGVTLRWLHPENGLADRVNDESMVIEIRVASRRILLTGDLEAAAIAELMRRCPDLRADVLELPHHGSFSPTALAFVRRLEPAVALQSTGRRRWARDPWAEMIDAVRLVTTRDGAGWVEIRDAADGPGILHTGCFRYADRFSLPLDPGAPHVDHHSRRRHPPARRHRPRPVRRRRHRMRGSRGGRA